MKNRVNRVVDIILFKMLILMVFCLVEFGLEVIVKGNILVLKVSDVMSIGCICWCVFLIIVIVGVFLECIVVWVNLIIKIVFFVDSLMVVNILIWK